MHLNKSLQVLGFPEIDKRWMNILRSGASKNDPKRDKSFIHIEQVEKIVKELMKAGRRDLARFVTIIYLYQLRTQNEGFPIQGGTPNKAIEKFWHSYVEIEEDGTVSLWLRKRKNCNRPCVIRRRCVCSTNALACGACSLRKAVELQPKNAGRSKLFPGVKASDVNMIKKICHENALGYFTWHGPRRGRTVDLVQGKDRSNNPKPTLREAHESGMWSVLAGSIHHYFKKDTMDSVRIASAVAAGSDSD